MVVVVFEDAITKIMPTSGKRNEYCFSNIKGSSKTKVSERTNKDVPWNIAATGPSAVSLLAARNSAFHTRSTTG
jgi:hypothetical protein